MTSANLLGPVLTRGAVRSSVLTHVRLWLPTYLRDVERAVGVRADGETELVPGDVPLPRSWRPTTGAVDKWPADQLPAVIFGTPGLSDAGVTRRGRGVHDATWAIALSAVCSGRDEATTEWLVDVYTTALRLMLVQQPMIEGLAVEGLSWVDEAYDDLPWRRAGALQVGTVSFELSLRDMADASAGPDEPLEDPTVDPGPWPEVETTELILERSLS